MNRISACLLTNLVFSVAATQLAIAAESENSQYRDYNLSMAGALVNGWCEENWESSEYISSAACNYHMAQLYNYDTSSKDFNECAVAAGGDIVQIADCMVQRFDAWIVKEELE